MQQAGAKQPTGLWKIIVASSAGTLIEWYDFYIFGSLAPILATQFFPKGNPTAALLSTLATFATGFLVRPFGALVFGRMGDTVGRKNTFLLTLLMMGSSTTILGLVPTYEQIGVFAPLIVLLLRLVQGLAIGGEYGGAAVYVAEHSPSHRQGFYTSWIQTTATLGLFASLIVILVTRTQLTEPVFASWGWRVPFLLSSVLVIFSYLIRTKMDESPLFARLKETGTTSTNPLRESFANPVNRRLVLIALFGVMSGQAVVWYTAQFYAQTFLSSVLNLQGASVNKIVAWAVAFATPFFVVFGSLSDRIGRKKVIMTGLLLASVFFIPIYQAMDSVGSFQAAPGVQANRSIETKIDKEKGTTTTTRTDVETNPDGAVKTVKTALDPADMSKPLAKEKPKTEVVPSSAMFWGLVALIWVQVFFAAMAYGPVAAFLVELFPVRIRYTSLSVPYHIGNGVFGGIVPLVGAALVASTGIHFAGVFYPIVVSVSAFIVGCTFIREKQTSEGFVEEA